MLLMHGSRGENRIVAVSRGGACLDGWCRLPAQLASYYRGSITLAETHGVRSLAFPDISSGVDGYPAALAARVAVVIACRALPPMPPSSK